MRTGGIAVDVGEMHTNRSRWAEEDKDRGCGDLYNRLGDENGRTAADIHVRQNAGSKTAGCDGITMRDVEQNLEGNLKEIREALKAERFEPHPVRRKDIREVKASGRVKERPLGRPDIGDRIVQDALRKVLEPIWEADFSRHS
jgi:RNA-directed DNA polymerase